jgi:hypothetical protein
MCPRLELVAAVRIISTLTPGKKPSAHAGDESSCSFRRIRNDRFPHRYGISLPIIMILIIIRITMHIQHLGIENARGNVGFDRVVASTAL